MGGQRVEVEGSQDQRHGQLLHGVDENQHDARQEAASQQGKVDTRQHPAGMASQGSGRGVHVGCDLGQTGFQRAEGQGQEPHGAGEDQGVERAAEYQPGRGVEMGSHEPVDGVVERGRGYEDPDRQHDPRDGVADARDAGGALDQGRAGKAGAVGQEEASAQADQRRQTGYGKTVEGEAQGVDTGRVSVAPHGGSGHEPGGNDETQSQRRGAGEQRQHPADAAEPGQGVSSRCVVAELVAAPAPGDPLQGGHHQHQGQHHGCQLCRGRGVVHAEPDAVDSDRQRLYRKVVYRSEVVQCLHQRQQHAYGNGRPGQRQAHSHEASPGPEPEPARRVPQVL